MDPADLRTDRNPNIGGLDPNNPNSLVDQHYGRVIGDILRRMAEARRDDDLRQRRAVEMDLAINLARKAGVPQAEIDKQLKISAQELALGSASAADGPSAGDYDNLVAVAKSYLRLPGLIRLATDIGMTTEAVARIVRDAEATESGRSDPAGAVLTRLLLDPDFKRLAAKAAAQKQAADKKRAEQWPKYRSWVQWRFDQYEQERLTFPNDLGPNAAAGPCNCDPPKLQTATQVLDKVKTLLVQHPGLRQDQVATPGHGARPGGHPVRAGARRHDDLGLGGSGRHAQGERPTRRRHGGGHI